MKKLLLIALLIVGCVVVFGQQPIMDSILKLPNSTEVKITTKDYLALKKGTIYKFNSIELFLNTACLKKRDYIAFGIVTGSFTGIGYLLALGANQLTEKYKVLSKIDYRTIKTIQIKKTNNRNAFIASGLLAIGLLSQANKPEMEGSALAFVWLPISLSPFLLKPYFSYSWENIYPVNVN
tara:strand:- start:131 stop:670 length:540 start_codon:yes stop_codon:yes gene_type:complete